MAILLDGSMGAALQKLGAPSGAYPELVNLTKPELVTELHRRYVEAGSEILMANTFSVTRERGQRGGYDFAENIEAALRCARAASGNDAKVALDISPSGKLLEPYGEMSRDEAFEHFRELAAAGLSADLIAIETMCDLNEAVIALQAARDAAPGLPVFVTLSFTASGRTMTGHSPRDMARELQDADAIGLNCSLGPVECLPIVQELAKYSTLPLIVKPNAGMPDREGNYSITPEAFGEAMKPYIGLGASFVGGCCGTNPEFIAALKRILE